jgi:hypothetical protein
VVSRRLPTWVGWGYLLLILFIAGIGLLLWLT